MCFGRILHAAAAALLLLPISDATRFAEDAKPEKPVCRIAFGSCAKEDRPQPIWDAVLACKPDLFIFLGDNIYGDTEDMDLLKAKYEKLGAQEGYQRLKAACRILATWDDHDYGQNDAGADYPRKHESQQIMLDFFGEPADSPRRKRDGVYDAKVFGPVGSRVQIILLDTRFNRSPLVKKKDPPKGHGPYDANNDPHSTILGDRQWKWLAEQLETPAEIRLIASSIQVISEDHGYEKWMNFPHERERLFKLLAASKAAGVIFISGDRHQGDLSLIDAGLGYPIYDLTSSALNQSSKNWRKPDDNRRRISSMPFGDNFGLIVIDWQAKEPTIALQLRDVEGDIQVNHKLTLAHLRPGVIK